MKRVAVFCLFVLICASTVVFSQGGAEARPVTYKVAHSYRPDHPFSAGMKRLAAMVAEKTGGKFTITEFPAGQLGSVKDLSDALVNSLLEMAILGPGDRWRVSQPIALFSLICRRYSGRY